MERAFVAWMRYYRRTDLLAAHLDATPIFIQYGQLNRVFLAPLRYVPQAVETWRILKRERPSLVIVQNPPIFLVLVAFLYARRFGAAYAIDSHSGAFLSPKWRWSLGLHRWLSNHARLTIIHNETQESIIQGWGCPYLIVGYAPGKYPTGEPYPVEGPFSVAVISSFGPDESPEVVFEAARRRPEIAFYVTGNAKRLSPALLSHRPSNCHLTGFLPYEQYVGLLRSVDAVMALTTQDDTLLMGGFEAVAVGKPFITSDFPVLKRYFSSGTIHIPYTAQGIATGVDQARMELGSLQRGMGVLQEKLCRDWGETHAQLRHMLSIAA